LKITKYGHSCLHVVDGSASILIDPGSFSQGFETLSGLTAVLITHQHADHVDQQRLTGLLRANPDATLYADGDSAEVLSGAGITATTVATELACGLGIAMLLNIDLPWIGVFRTALVVPMMITPIVAALCWKLLLDPDHGVVNYWIGSHIVWLGRPDTALLSVMVVNLWQNAPYVAVLLLAGLRSLPSEPVEAASIDGASRWQVFWHVTLPLLRPYILVALLLRTIFEFRAFDNIYVMTSGGPANATMTLSMFTYLASFVRFDLSLGAAASWLMLAMCLLLCLFFIAVIRRRDAT